MQNLNILCKFVVIFVTILVVNAGPSPQQEKDIMILDALTPKRPSVSYNTNKNQDYSSNSIIDMLGRSMFNVVLCAKNC